MFTFAKQHMRLSELVAAGFSETELKTAYRSRGQRFAYKMNPDKRNSPIVFDTAGLARYFENLARREDEARRAHLW